MIAHIANEASKWNTLKLAVYQRLVVGTHHVKVCEQLGWQSDNIFESTEEIIIYYSNHLFLLTPEIDQLQLLCSWGQKNWDIRIFLLSFNFVWILCSIGWY